MLILTLLLVFQQANARVWEGQHAAFEAFLRSAQIARMTKLDVGVTHPKRIFFADGGLARSAAWKPLRPGFQNGYWESYKSEIAAYELDKLLGMDMVPVTVERRVDGLAGAAVLWLDGVRTWGEVAPPDTPSWHRQVARMKMFDDLIGNPDRNKGNILIDAEFNIFLIDHSRAFLDDRGLPQPLAHVDAGLWTRMAALDQPALTAALGTWLRKPQIAAILARRDKMAAAIDALVRKNGRAAVFVW
jgi:hypothetical protein